MPLAHVSKIIDGLAGFVNAPVNECITNWYYHIYQRSQNSTDRGLKQIALTHYNTKVCLYNLATVISIAAFVHSCMRGRFFGILGSSTFLMTARQVIRVSIFDAPKEIKMLRDLSKSFGSICEELFHRRVSIWDDSVSQTAIAAAKGWRDSSIPLEQVIGPLVLWKKFIYLPSESSQN